MTDKYSQKFEDVMKYINVPAGEIDSQAKLIDFFRSENERQINKGIQPKMSREFIGEISSSSSAREFIRGEVSQREVKRRSMAYTNSRKNIIRMGYDPIGDHYVKSKKQRVATFKSKRNQIVYVDDLGKIRDERGRYRSLKR